MPSDEIYLSVVTVKGTRFFRAIWWLWNNKMFKESPLSGYSIWMNFVEHGIINVGEGWFWFTLLFFSWRCCVSSSIVANERDLNGNFPKVGNTAVVWPTMIWMDCVTQCYQRHVHHLLNEFSHREFVYLVHRREQAKHTIFLENW